MVIAAIEQHADVTGDTETHADHHQQLAEQLDQRDHHAAQEYQDGDALHATVVKTEHSRPDRIAAGLAEQAEIHDRQEIGWDIEEERRQNQREATAFPLMAMRGQLETAARTIGFLARSQGFPAHQQITLMASNQFFQGKILQATDIGIGHE